MKQTPAHLKAKALRGTKASRLKRASSHRSPNSFVAESASASSPKDDHLDREPIAAGDSDLNRIKELPKEVGIMLITAGIVGLILPGPGTPAIIAGGLALWPTAFGKLESWLERHHPGVHRQGMKQIGRFLNDLERRYPYVDRDGGYSDCSISKQPGSVPAAVEK